MSHRYAQHVIHLVFSTKDRDRIFPPNCGPSLCAYVAVFASRTEYLCM